MLAKLWLNTVVAEAATASAHAKVLKQTQLLRTLFLAKYVTAAAAATAARTVPVNSVKLPETDSLKSLDALTLIRLIPN